MSNQQVIGIDPGGTHVRAGIIEKDQITKMVSDRIPASGNVEDVRQPWGGVLPPPSYAKENDSKMHTYILAEDKYI